MSTYILMKILESAPRRYDRGIRLLTLGRVDKAYDRLATWIKEGQRVLDLGCGTGALCFRAARRGAEVKGIDVDSRMLEIARIRAEKTNLSHKIELCEMGVAELGREERDSYDAVMSGLCFSELSEEELAFALREVKRILKPEGLLLVGDEVKPEKISKRIISWLVRVILGTIVYLLTQSSTRAIRDLPEKIKISGFDIVLLNLDSWENFIELVARKPGEESR